MTESFDHTIFEWITGNWRGENGEVLIEEQWSEVKGDSLMGMFRMLRNNSPVFYELMTLTNINTVIEMRIKHFSANLSGWEEKDNFISFGLVEQLDNKAVFKQNFVDSDVYLIYERIGEKLEVTLKKDKESKFIYIRN